MKLTLPKQHDTWIYIDDGHIQWYYKIITNIFNGNFIMESKNFDGWTDSYINCAGIDNSNSFYRWLIEGNMRRIVK